MNSRILITGSRGFIGSYLTREMKIAENNSLEVRLWQTGTAYPGSPIITKTANTPGASHSYMRVGEGGYTDTFSLFDNIRIRKYASLRARLLPILRYTKYCRARCT